MFAARLLALAVRPMGLFVEYDVAARVAASGAYVDVLGVLVKAFALKLKALILTICAHRQFV